MIEIARRLAGILPYSAFYFPDDRTVEDMINNLDVWRVARLFFTRKSLTNGRCMIARYVTTTVNSDLTQTLESLWRAMDDTCRRQVRRAEKLERRTRIEFNQPGNHEDFLALLEGLAKQNKQVATISKNRLAELAASADVFVLYLDDKPNCAHLFLRDAQAGRARLLHSANRRLEEPQNARASADLNRMLHWHEMKLYKDQGFALFDLGGISDQANDGIARFKVSFGGAIVHEYVYLCAGLPWLANAGRLVFEKLTTRGRQWSARSEQFAAVNEDSKESRVQS